MTSLFLYVISHMLPFSSLQSYTLWLHWYVMCGFFRPSMHCPAERWGLWCEKRWPLEGTNGMIYLFIFLPFGMISLLLVQPRFCLIFSLLILWDSELCYVHFTRGLQLLWWFLLIFVPDIACWYMKFLIELILADGYMSIVIYNVLYGWDRSL